MRGEGKRRIAALALLFALAPSVLAGCMYPDEARRQSAMSGSEYIVVVQDAVDRFQQNNGVLPIRTYSAETPIYEQNIVNLKQLVDRGYLSEAPPNAFEKGGAFYYVLVDAETKPTVKLLDLTAAQRVNDVQQAVDSYASRHNGRVPASGAVSPGWYAIDYGKLGVDETTVPSAYTPAELRLLVSGRGRVVIDYAPEIMKLIQAKSLVPAADADLRKLLVDNANYVPVKSAPYRWVNGEPVLQTEGS